MTPSRGPGDPESTTGSVTSDVQGLLSGLADRQLGEHVAAFDEVHRRLQDALATLDEA
ncbi:MAG: hypothetical protein M3N21_01105 [Actinomycetota bacterium]|nr:hypothetical protein [Actinomycetota bacterium]